MRKRVVAVLWCTAMLLCRFAPVAAQVMIARDIGIERMLQQISPAEMEKTVHTLSDFGTRHTFSDTLSPSRGIGAAQRWIYAQLQTYSKHIGGRLAVRYDTFILPPDGKRVPKARVVRNILAFLPGTDTSCHDIVAVSGHVDSRASDVMDTNSMAPGANDDASGTAAVMELARVMSQSTYKKSLLFCLVTGEEQGLYGSAHLALQLKNDQKNIVAMLNNDIIGNTVGSGNHFKENSVVRVFSSPATDLEPGYENDSPSRNLARYLKEVGERYEQHFNVKLIYRKDRYLRGGDHTSFLNEGFSAVRLTELNENFERQHQNVRVENGVSFGDSPDYVDYEYLAKVCRINASSMANLAQSPPPPSHFKIVTRDLSNSSTLDWDKDHSPNPFGFYLLIRETSSPLWEKKIFVKGNHIEVNYSKDNYLFGLQSVDEAGHESLISTPRPAH